MNNRITLLNLLGAYDNIRIRWVKAHAQCAGKNRADEIARCGAQTAKAEEAGLDYEEIMDLPAPYTSLRKKVQDGIENLWTEKRANELYPDRRPMYREMVRNAEQGKVVRPHSQPLRDTRQVHAVHHGPRPREQTPELDGRHGCRESRR